jgi:hypothetical protein
LISDLVGERRSVGDRFALDAVPDGGPGSAVTRAGDVPDQHAVRRSRVTVFSVRAAPADVIAGGSHDSRIAHRTDDAAVSRNL